MTDLLRKYLLPVFDTADPPNGGAVADPPAAVDPPAPVVTDPPAGDPPADPVVDPAPEPKRPQMVPLDVVTGLRGKNRELEARATAAEREAADARALAERLSRGDGTQQPPVQPNAPAPNQAEFDNAVRSEAQRQRLAQDSVEILQAGNSTFNDFAASRNILSALGAFDSFDFTADLLAVDKANAHVIIDKLAKDPERAALIVGMDSRRRTAELTRMAMAATSENPTAPALAIVPKTAAVPAKTVSRAPAPAPAVTPSASKVIDGYSDEATDEQFTAQFNERMKARGVRR